IEKVAEATNLRNFGLSERLLSVACECSPVFTRNLDKRAK
ncbi:MAG: hypothetical protein RLZZ443_48, partial [Actinomycetota bacterium]